MLRRLALIGAIVLIAVIGGWLAYWPWWRSTQEDDIREAMVRYEIARVRERWPGVTVQLSTELRSTPDWTREIDELERRLDGTPGFANRSANLDGQRVFKYCSMDQLTWTDDRRVSATAICYPALKPGQ